MALFLAPVCQGQAIDVDGNPRTGGKIYTYLAGTSTPTATYTTEAGSTPHANPIILNSLGQTPNPIWITSGLSYKFVETDSADVVIRTTDNIDGVNDTTQTASEWFDSGFTPTYISATSFSVAGDQTSTLQIGRRLKTTNTGGAIYSTITNSVYGSATTVTVTNDSGTLDAGLSVVAYGLLSATNPSVPAIYVRTGLATASGLTMSTARMLGRTTAGTGALEEKTSAEVTAFLAAATETAQGAVEMATVAEGQSGIDGTRFITSVVMKAAQIQLGAAVTLTTQTAVDFTSIPAWVNRISLHFSGVSTNGTSVPIVQLGDSGGIETSGYTGNVSVGSNGVAWTVGATPAAGFGMSTSTAAGSVYTGKIVLSRINGNEWIASGDWAQTTATITVHLLTGAKTLSATLTQVRLTTSGGSDQFDAGTVNVSYE